MSAAIKEKVSSVSLIKMNCAVFLSPMVSSSISSYAMRSRTSLMSNTASLAPQLIRIDLAVLPAAACQGFSNQPFVIVDI